MTIAIVAAIASLAAFLVGFYLGRSQTRRMRYGAGEVTEAVFRVTGAGTQTLVAILRQLEEARK